MRYLDALDAADLAQRRAARLAESAVTRRQQAYAAEQETHAAAVRQAALIAQLCEEYVRGR